MNKTRKIALGGFAGLMALGLTACGTTATGSPPAAPPPVTVTQAPVTVTQAPVTVTQTSAAARAAPASATPAAEAAPAGVPMPDVVGMNLQAAQDHIQTLGVFFSRSEDATGPAVRRFSTATGSWSVRPPSRAC